MPSFDVVSEVNHHELGNAVDQANREVSNRFDFKQTNSSVELAETTVTLRSSTEERLAALKQVLEEKMAKRKVSMKALDWGNVEEASGGTARQVATLVAGIGSDKAKEINKVIKEMGLKGVQTQTQGEQIRVTAKKRDALQDVISACKDKDFGIPLQFGNFRD
jgi:hypothetical protein